MRDLTTILVLTAATAFLSGCGPSRKSDEGSVQELSRALREVEKLRAERRETSLKLREAEKDLQSAKKELASRPTGSTPDEDVANRILALEAQVLQLQEELSRAQAAAAQAAATAQALPGPDDMARLFVTAVRSRDRRAMESLIDSRGLLETVLSQGATNSAEAEAALRALSELSEDDRKERAKDAQAEFVSFLLGHSGPSINMGQTFRESGERFVRVRTADGTREGVTWDVLMARRQGTWKVVGMVRMDPPATDETATPVDGDGINPDER